uniref:ThiF domain-containing protein n=1 Tax=Heterorhabditis bacteriophora TaxID=37862 RepID=A0A1I7WB14_HETBA
MLRQTVHTSIAKEAKLELNEAKNSSKDIRVVCIGDKSRGALQRVYSKNFILTGNDIGRAPPTFADASVAAKAILDTGFEFEDRALYHRHYC